MIGSTYVERDSALHRLRPGVKLVALPILGTLLFALPGLVPSAFGLALVLFLYAAAKIPPAVLLRQLRPVALVLAFIFLAQLWIAGLPLATLAVLRFLALILAAALVTLTTRSADMIAALEKGFSFLAFAGVDAAKCSLAISLVIRFFPVIQSVLSEVREAQAARGRSASLFALAAPVVVRTLKLADEVAEAIDARS
ncbi:cobalt ABC transporter permease [Aureimonas sp. SA4125]|uniref:energy-coupling factor transporter transmembrane component T family protein n=1 Tax=Aureimonas sp. SA4125 TaxID=2826993 RepID=UPI001CC497FA|nr:energy-coupling factor transporter transmembrane protein EcfT [Aureimonas sp. SA4125]BDA83867.1 cobalt ABC transporter permease [Aureimonas sp. SA4125]